MGIDNKDELDDELVKSLERLVEEETSVAKALRSCAGPCP